MNRTGQSANRVLASSSDWLAIAIQLLSGGAAIATLLSFAGSLWWGFALLEHGRSQYSWLLLIGLCFALLRLSHWRTNQVGMNVQIACGVLWAILLVVNLSYFFGLFLMPSQNAAASASSTVLTVLHVTLDHDNPDVSEAIAFINQQTQPQAPDVMSILEVTPQSLPQLQAGLPDYQLAIAEPRPNSHGSAWFVSRHPAQPLDGAKLSFDSPARRQRSPFTAAQHCLCRKSDRAAVFSCHSPPERRNGGLSAR